MKVVLIKNYETGEELAQLRTSKLENLHYDLAKLLSNEQEKEDILGLGYTCRILDAGITSYWEKGVVMSNETDNGESTIFHTGRNSAVLGSGASVSGLTQNRVPSVVEVFQNGKRMKTSLRLTVTAYPEGYVLSTGKQSVNIFGTRSDMYLKSIGKSNVRFTSLMGAHIFPTIASLKTYVEKHRSVMEHLVKKKGYNFQVEIASEFFAPSFKDIPVKDQKIMPDLFAMLSDINASYEPESPEEFEDEPMTGTATQEEMKSEAIRRLEDLDVMSSVVSAFKRTGKIYRSEFGGILYDLDEISKTAIGMLPEDYTPYAVICTHTVFGTIYDVLYVTPNKGDWPYERMDRNGFCASYAYNADDPQLSEFGSIQIQNANGGIVRMA